MVSTRYPFIPWPDLEWDLYRNLYGQHLVQDIVSEEVAKFLQNKNPDRPLVLSFNGPSGTGKTLVSSMLGNHLYGSAMSSPYVHQFVPTLHFPLPDRVKQYRVSWELAQFCSLLELLRGWNSVYLLPGGLKELGAGQPDGMCSLSLLFWWDGEDASRCRRCLGALPGAVTRCVSY